MSRPQPTEIDVVLTKRANADPIKTSELAKLMRYMYDETARIKPLIASSKRIGSFPKKFASVHTATPTDPAEHNETFKIFADNYLNATQTLYAKPSTASYNLVVQSCLNCHQTHCLGPLSRIKALMLPPS